jgi:hypothetical protein
MPFGKCVLMPDRSASTAFHQGNRPAAVALAPGGATVVAGFPTGFWVGVKPRRLAVEATNTVDWLVECLPVTRRGQRPIAVLNLSSAVFKSRAAVLPDSPCRIK